MSSPASLGTTPAFFCLAMICSRNTSQPASNFPLYLSDQSFDTWGVDATYAANEKVSFFAGYVYEKYFFKMAAAYILQGAIDALTMA